MLLLGDPFVMIYHVVVFAHNNSPNTDGREQTVYRGGDVKEQNIICNISNFKWLKPGPFLYVF